MRVLLLSILLAATLFCVNAQELITDGGKTRGSIIVINNETPVFKSFENNAETILTLDFLNCLTVLKAEITNYRILVEVNGLRGWVRVDDTSYIPNRWTTNNVLNGVIISYPKDFEFNLLKDVRKDDKYLLSEYKLYNKDYFIYISCLNDNINNYLKEEDNRNPLIFKKYPYISFKCSNISGFYQKGYASTDSKKYHSLLIKGKDKIFIIVVYIKKVGYNEKDENLAKKILFSYKLK